jgi:ABC-type sugar transport system permease subunit/ABC-type glycerol-3-phosphate transport system substrate-binding protein
MGDEGRVLREQLRRFSLDHPGIKVRPIVMPDAADQRHQLFVQWLNAGSADPDVLQIDVVWTAELAAAGWIRPLDAFAPDTTDYFPNVLEAGVHERRLYALPWFVDVGMLYWRTDLFGHAPRYLDELSSMAQRAMERGDTDHGLALEAARYEGLITNFQEILGAFGARILDDDDHVVVDSDAAVRALEWLRDAIHRDGIVPEDALGWREEQARFAFQNERTAFLRNWPYAYALLADPASSRVAGRFAIAPMPRAEGGAPTAALGGQLLAINARSEHPTEAFELLTYLSEPEQMLERLEVAGQLPPRTSLYRDPRFAAASMIPRDEILPVIEHAVARPVTPIYSELSRTLQIHVHRALSKQESPRVALSEAADEMRSLLSRGASMEGVTTRTTSFAWVIVGLVIALGLAFAVHRLRRQAPSREERLAWMLVLPTLLVISLVALMPLCATVWESFFEHDLRMPWRGSQFVRTGNYAELFESTRFWEALAHTLLFAASTVSLELVLGLALALALESMIRGRGVARTTALIPWALPTVVAALLWRFLFEGESSIANAFLVGTHLREEPLAFFAHSASAWVPLIAADVWKTTPFAALLLMAGLSAIDPSLHEAARVDGAGAVRRFFFITLPLLRPSILVLLLFRTLDALRVFDLVYVMTGGGPGTATEPLALYAFHALLDDLRFGYGSAASVFIFLCTLVLAALYVRLLGAGSEESR